jgi:hypothetical protein
MMTARRWIGVLGVLALGALAYRFWPQQGPEEVGVVSDLAGRWVTDDQRWAGRYLEITSTAIAFGRGEDGEARYPIDGVYRLAPRDGRATYSIRYRETEGSEQESALVVSVAAGELRIDHQRDVRWVHAP